MFFLLTYRQYGEIGVNMKYYVIKEQFNKTTVLLGKGNTIIYRSDYLSKYRNEYKPNVAKFGYKRLQDAQKNTFYKRYKNSIYTTISIIEMEIN